MRNVELYLTKESEPDVDWVRVVKGAENRWGIGFIDERLVSVKTDRDGRMVVESVELLPALKIIRDIHVAEFTNDAEIEVSDVGQIRIVDRMIAALTEGGSL